MNSNKSLVSLIVIIGILVGIISCQKNDDDSSPSKTSVNKDLPVVVVKSIDDIKAYSALLNGEVESEGTSAVSARGFCWSLNPTPSVSDSYSSNNFGPGIFNFSLDGLTPATTYYIRAYATNASGTVYSNEVNFKTITAGSGDVLPTVVASPVDAIGSQFATLHGEVKNEGSSAVYGRGFCWSTSTLPTVNDLYSINDFGPGVFDHNITDLEPSTTYYIRAYAVSNIGTSYSNEVSFITNSPEIGTEFQGGIIAYVDGSGQHGFIVAKDNYQELWGCNGTALTGCQDKQIGSGKTNTQSIVNQCNDPDFAAKFCSDFESDGFDDWFLPSYDELYQIYLKKDDIGTVFIPDGTGSIYISSSQFSVNSQSFAWGINFGNFVPDLGFSKGQAHYFRPIRNF